MDSIAARYELHVARFDCYNLFFLVTYRVSS